LPISFYYVILLHTNGLFRAIKADILILNEIGLDPGIDHCSAVDLCEKIRADGREIVSFVSVCGGLPAPEDSNVPLGYKFSWSPKGVLSAALNGAKFRLSGKVGFHVDFDGVRHRD
jgi:alpha-aminoadipic semialdehyde synthase